MQVLSFTKNVGQLGMILLFQLTAPYLFGDGKQHPLRYLPLLVYPALQLTFLFARNGVTRDVVKAEQVGQDQLVNHVDYTVSNYRLIAEYNRRPHFVDQFQEKIKAYNGSATKAGKVVKNNATFSEWITIVYVAIYTFTGGMDYIDGSLTLGMLLTNITILGTIGKSTGQIYSTLLVLQRNVPSLERVVNYMNLPTDVRHRKNLNRARRAMTKELRKEARASIETGIPCDRMTINIRDFKFAYNTNIAAKRQSSVKSPITPRIEKMEIEQGSMVLLVGPRGEWKSTILKILGGVVLPPVEREDELGFFVPSHLRVLHVSCEPMFFPGTLKENLLFGVSPGDPDGDDLRVEKVCRKLGLPEQVLQYLETNDKMDWGSMLSQTQRQILSLARSLIANPEVVCIHKPAMIFDEASSKDIFQVLRDFVDDRGLFQDPDTKHLRRPRTCIITSNKISAEQVADRTYHVSKAGIRYLSKGQVTESLMGA
jgi:ABC-type multidrug transport system fused ATPase/permease subunit